MGSFTIHHLDAELDLKLTQEAKRAKKSKNQLIKELLARSLGMPEGEVYADEYREFCGLWSSTEKEAFDALQEKNSSIDPQDWNVK